MKGLLDHPRLYRLWQAPFAKQKLRPIGPLDPLRNAGRVLDVACGPGNHAHLFEPCSYTGIDTNPAYIKYAVDHHHGDFQVADARTYAPSDGIAFDLVFAGSFLHHLDDAGAAQALGNLANLTNPNGRLLLMDLVLPPKRSLARSLAQADRGDWPRSLNAWQQLCTQSYHILRAEPYRLHLAGIPLWQMIFIEATPRS